MFCISFFQHSCCSHLHSHAVILTIETGGPSEPPPSYVFCSSIQLSSLECSSPTDFIINPSLIPELILSPSNIWTWHSVFPVLLSCQLFYSTHGHVTCPLPYTLCCNTDHQSIMSLNAVLPTLAWKSSRLPGLPSWRSFHLTPPCWSQTVASYDVFLWSLNLSSK